MIDRGKRNVLGVLVDAVDYESVVTKAMGAAEQRRGLAVTALAVHGVMTGVMDRTQRHRLNTFDVVTPDGQPVRWVLNLIHRVGLSERVYGPSLMLEICRAAALRGYPIYLYGSSPEVLERMTFGLRQRVPGVTIAGAEPSKFRPTSPEEKAGIVSRIRESGARITFVGLGCPRQEMFAYEYRSTLSMPVVAVGAAFPYFAGLLREPPPWMQRAGLQWLYRLSQEPRRLWKRYMVLNPAFLALSAVQAARLWKPDPADAEVPDHETLVG